jgi:hypothetical protein
MSPKSNSRAEVTVTDNAITVILPKKDEMPTSNSEAMDRFGEALTVLLRKFNEAEKGSDVKKKLRRQIRKLGYSLADNRQRGILTIEL